MDKFTQIYGMLMKKASINISKKRIVKEDQDIADMLNANTAIDGAGPANGEQANEYPGFAFDGGNKQYIKEFDFTDDAGTTTSFKLVVVAEESNPNSVGGSEGTTVSISLSDSDDTIMEAFSSVSGSRQDQLKSAIENLCGKLAKLQNSIREAAEMTGVANGLLTEGDDVPPDDSSVDGCDGSCDGEDCDCGKPKKKFGGAVVKRCKPPVKCGGPDAAGNRLQKRR